MVSDMGSPAYKLTPNETNPVTGAQVPLYGWRFVGADSLKVFGSFNYLHAAGWDYQLGKNPADRRYQQLSLTKQLGDGQTPVQIVIKYGDYYAFEGTVMKKIASEDADANYTVENYTMPDIPPELLVV